MIFIVHNIETNNDIKILCLGLANSNVSAREQNRQFIYTNALCIECVIFEG